MLLFQSTPPARGATQLNQGGIITTCHFNPRPPRGGRLSSPHFIKKLQTFQSTPPARGATVWASACVEMFTISIHAPREGGDNLCCFGVARHDDFNPRPPRGGRLRPALWQYLYAPFQSTPPARGATLLHTADMIATCISIHAPREGGDTSNALECLNDVKFQSTPPARGATSYKTDQFPPMTISIHAPREGGDI